VAGVLELMAASGTVLAIVGFALAWQQGPWWGSISAALALVLMGLVAKHDPYSAQARIFFRNYLQLQHENPHASDFDCLYSIVKGRFPQWSEERMLELCAGKNIRQLSLILLLLENEIHPLEDMALYAWIKARIEKTIPLSPE
jgi:hypothetical protein